MSKIIDAIPTSPPDIKPILPEKCVLAIQNTCLYKLSLHYHALLRL